jgi:subfamily B ATP-binding cassette protein HlyB/CyaB
MHCCQLHFHRDKGNTTGMDTALQALLVTIAQFHKLPAEPAQLAHQFGQPGQSFGDTELLQAAKALTLKAH